MAAPLLFGIALVEIAVEAALVTMGIVGTAALSEKVMEINDQSEKLSDNMPSSIEKCPRTDEINDMGKRIKKVDVEIGEFEFFEKKDRDLRDKLTKIKDKITEKEGYQETDEEWSKLIEESEEILEKIESNDRRRRLTEDHFKTSLSQLRNSRKQLEREREGKIAKLKKFRSEKIREERSKEDLKRLARESGLDKTVGQGDKVGFPKVERDANGVLIGIKYPKNPPKPEP